MLHVRRELSIFHEIALGEKIFDSSDPSIPEALKDKVPLAIPYLDPNAQTQAFGITYKAQNINKRIFSMTISNRSSNITIWGDASGKLTTSVGSLTKVDMSHRIGMIFWPGSFKLYKTYSYTSVIKGYAPVRVILRSHVIPMDSQLF